MTLAELLDHHRPAIAADWAVRARALPGAGYGSRPAAEIREWAEQALGSVIESQRSGSAGPLRDRAVAISQKRAEQGFEIEEVVDGLLLLKEAAAPFIARAWCDDIRGAEAAVLALDGCLRVMVAHFARLFADEMQRAVQQQQDRAAVVEERQRLARELHDSVSQSLYGVRMYAEAAARELKAGDAAAAAALLCDVRDSAVDALGEMRFLVFDLRPPILGEEGLVRALRARLAAVESRAGVQVDLSADDGDQWPPDVADALYGIAREALNNVIKHARATRIAIRLARDPAGTTLDISDNGAGCDPAAAGASGGLGLRGMRERAGRIRATLSLTSRPGEGTRVHVAVPPEPAGEPAGAGSSRLGSPS